MECKSKTQIEEESREIENKIRLPLRVSKLQSVELSLSASH